MNTARNKFPTRTSSAPSIIITAQYVKILAISDFFLAERPSSG